MNMRGISNYSDEKQLALKKFDYKRALEDSGYNHEINFARPKPAKEEKIPNSERPVVQSIFQQQCVDEHRKEILRLDVQAFSSNPRTLLHC